ncbi:MAG: hypothetical protein HY553_11295 [Elusimicrobia bacterium]|nr:hypothetical protein [Elusimicrobiota bacterium]
MRSLAVLAFVAAASAPAAFAQPSESSFAAGLAGGREDVSHSLQRMAERGFARDSNRVRSPYTAECWWNHIDYNGSQYDYPNCASLGYKESQRSNRYAERAWLDSIELVSIEPASFIGTPLEAEVLQAVASSVVRGGPQAPGAGALPGLFQMLRLATAVPPDRATSRRRVNAAVKSRRFLVELYAEACEKHAALCAPSFLEDFYGIAKHDWSPRTRAAAIGFIYFFESDRAKAERALSEMAAHDGAALLSVASDGSMSYAAQPSSRNKSLAAYLLKEAPPRSPGPWGCFVERLSARDSRLNDYSVAKPSCR